MVAALDARAVEDGAESGVLVEDLALKDAAVLECKVEHVPKGCVWHRVEPYDRRVSVQGLHDVANAAEVAMTAMQTPHAADRRSLRHFSPTSDREMQGIHPYRMSEYVPIYKIDQSRRAILPSRE